ncbi:MAG: phage protein Gp36 family protein [Lentisphaeria bacterium]
MYATIANLVERLGTIAVSLYQNDDEKITADLEAASSEIDVILAVRYAVPVTKEEAMSLLKDWCLTLAVERAYMNGGGSKLPEKVIRRSDEVRKLLRSCAAGTFQLPADPTGSESGVAGTSIIQCDPPIFNRENMAGF